MRVPLVDLQSQYRAIRDEIDQAIQSTLDSSAFILSDEVEAFESEFAQFVGTKYCVSVGSGSDALFLALEAMGIGHGDEVLLPANTFIASALAITRAGARVKLTDIDPESYNLDLGSASISENTKAVMPVHLYGQPADMTAVKAIAQQHRLKVVEDAAQAHGSIHREGPCGGLGDVSGFSFYPGKNLGAYGDGGAVCTNDAAISDRIRTQRNWGSQRKYFHETKGYNCRLDGIQAAVLRVKLRHLASWNEARIRVASWYREELDDLQHELKLPSEVEGTVRHVYHLYVVQILHHSRDAVLESLNASGVGAGIHYPRPIHLQQAYQDLGCGVGSFPVTESLASRIISLPLFPEMDRESVAYVSAKLRDALQIDRRI